MPRSPVAAVLNVVSGPDHIGCIVRQGVVLQTAVGHLDQVVLLLRAVEWSSWNPTLASKVLKTAHLWGLAENELNRYFFSFESRYLEFMQL
jgi:hypothetical protein